MAAFNKFLDFSEQLARGVHDFDAHVFKVALTNTQPINTQVSFDPVTNHAAPAAANGYAPGTTTITLAEAAGTTTVSGTQVVFTATAGGVGPFRYAVLYNDSATSPVDALVCWFDYGAPITLLDTETLTWKPSNTSPGAIFTLA